MKITWQTFEEWKTAPGGWTGLQIKLLISELGEEYPPKSGWKERLIGKEISEDFYYQVMQAKFVYKKGKRSSELIDPPMPKNYCQCCGQLLPKPWV